MYSRAPGYKGLTWLTLRTCTRGGAIDSDFARCRCGMRAYRPPLEGPQDSNLEDEAQADDHQENAVQALDGGRRQPQRDPRAEKRPEDQTERHEC